MKRLCYGFSILFLCLLSTFAWAAGTIYYVDSDVTDTNVASATADFTTYDPTTFATTGGTASVYKTIADINACSFSAGDQILFRKGQTWREQLTVPSSGSAGNPLTFGAYGSGALPIIDGSNLITTWTAHAGGTSPTESDGFEVGDADLSNGDGAYWGGGSASNATIVGNDTTVVLSGTYSAKVSWSSASGSAQAYTYNTITQGNENYNQFMMRVTSYPASGASSSLNMFLYNSTPRCQVKIISASATTYTLNLYIQTDGSSTTLTGTTALTMGRWYTLETYYKIDNAAGGGQYWIDGVSEGSNLALDTSFSNSQPNRQGVGIGDCNTAGRAGATIYFDNAKYHTAYMGPFYANIWQADLTTEPKQIFQDGTRLTHGSSVVTLHSSEWYWDSNVLYMYSIADPDTYASPGIEASVRSNCITANGKSYLTIENLSLQKGNDVNLTTGGGNNSNITIDGVTAGKGYAAGISSSGSYTTQSVTVQNCTANWNGGSGIQIQTPSYNWTIQNNTVHNNSQVYNGVGDTAMYYTGGIKGWSGDASVTGILISGNTVYSNGVLPDSSYSSNPVGGKGIWLDTFVNVSYATGPVVTKNLVYDNNADGILVENGQYNSVYYNIVRAHTRNNGYGIRVSDWHKTSPADYNKVYNNVLYANNYGIAVMGDRDSSAANRAVGNLVKNNISYGNLLRQFVASYGGENDGTMGSGNVYANNCFGAEAAQFIEWANGAYKTTIAAFNSVADDTTGGGSNISSDPSFVSTTTPDFHLQAGSPCINAGTDVGLTVDYEGRTVRGNPDIGAYEYARRSTRRVPGNRSMRRGRDD